VFVAAALVAAPGCGRGCERSPSGAGSGIATSAGTTAPTSPTGELRIGGERVILADVERPGPRASRPGEGRDPHADLIREPTSPDPEGGDFTLEEAVVGLGTDGTLVAEIGTELGVMQCDLFADKAPRTVANFIGLARGLRPWWDARAGVWQRKPYYRDTTFHRVIPEYMIQGGDYLGDGTGTVGYVIPDELHPSLPHDRAGLLCMANTGKDQNGAQFFILDGPAPQLDAMGTYTVFGRCLQTDVVSRIARVPQTGAPENRPLTPVYITRVVVRRVVGGAANAPFTRPIDPRTGQPFTGDAPRGASPDPSRPPFRRPGEDDHGH
jgi:peptidyl-prolyl cis-trans isomerase A (cyclophilin A)